MSKLFFDEIIRLWYACNEKCLFCNFTEINEPWYKHKNLEDITKEIDELIKKHKNPKNISIFFSWGEPLLWKNILVESIKYAKQKNIWNIWIQSNVTLLTDEFLISLKNAWLQKVLVSLHACNDEINDQITLLKNSFQKAYFWIKLLKKHKVNFIINHVLNKINYKYFQDFIDFVINDLKQKELSLWVVQPHWYAYQNFEQICINYDEIVPYIEKWIKKAWNKLNIITHYCDIPFCKYTKNNFDLNLYTLYQIRTSWENIQNYSNKITVSKTKSLDCKKCLYKNYCYWFWNEYIKKIWIDNIKLKDEYLNFWKFDFFQNQVNQKIEDKNFIYFLNQTKLSTIKKDVKNKWLIFQLCLFYEEINIDILEFIKSWINVVNLDLTKTNEIDINLILEFVSKILKFWNLNKPYFETTIFIKTKNNNLKKLLNKVFNDKIIII